MQLFEFNEPPDFVKKNVTKRQEMNSECNSRGGKVLLNIVQRSEVSYFPTRKIKTKIPNIAEEKDDVSTVTQATQNTYEIKMVEIEAQLYKFKADIKSKVKFCNTAANTFGYTNYTESREY